MHEHLTKLFNNKTVSFALFLVLAASLTWNTVKVIQRNFDLQQQVNELTSQIELLKLQNQNAKYEIEYFKTDTFLELAAREKFQKAAPGETVVNLPKDTPIETGGSTAEELAEDTINNFDAWMQFFFRSNSED